jgi:hypothetical protein
MHDRIIRPYGGDFLVVILLYCLMRSITNLSIPVASVSALLFSWLTEVLQYFKLADRLRIQPDSFFYILLGNYYSWTDMTIYALGIFAVLFIEKSWPRYAVYKNNLICA